MLEQQNITTGGIYKHIQKESWLEDFSSLHALDDRVWQDACARMRFVSLPADTLIVREGNRLENYLLLMEGKVRFQKLSTNGRQITVLRVQGGQSCALATACLLSDNPLPASAAADSDIWGGVINKADFIRCLHQSPNFRRFLFLNFGEQLHDVMCLIEQLAFEPLDARIAKYLLTCDAENSIVKKSHQDIADELGTVREVVTREIRNFKNRSWLSVGRGYITLHNRMALLGVANGRAAQSPAHEMH